MAKKEDAAQSELHLEPPAPGLTIREFADRYDEFLPKREITRTVTLNLPDDLWLKLKALARFRDLPMSHVVAVAAKPLVNKLYAEMQNDYTAAMRGEKRKR